MWRYKSKSYEGRRDRTGLRCESKGAATSFGLNDSGVFNVQCPQRGKSLLGANFFSNNTICRDILSHLRDMYILQEWFVVSSVIFNIYFCMGLKIGFQAREPASPFGLLGWS